jgi:sRNA-binding protein
MKAELPRVVDPGAAGRPGAAAASWTHRPIPSRRTSTGVQSAIRQAEQSWMVPLATQRRSARRCTRTGSLSGPLHTQQRWPAARKYASSSARRSGGRRATWRAIDATARSWAGRRAPPRAEDRLIGAIAGPPP